MFCRNCGTQNQDGAGFCCSCGAPLSSGGPAGGGAAAKAKNINVKLIGIVAAVVVVLFVAFKLLFGGGGGPEKSATKFVDSIFKGDGKAIVNMIPDKVVEEIMDEEDMTKKEMIEELNDGLEYIKDDMDDMYDKWSVKCKVLDTEDFSKRELRDLADRYEDSYDIDVKAAKTVSVKATLKADGETDSNTMDIVMIKVGGKWYLEYSSINRYF
ncbi:MAG: zinc ribbon domain-containing protein [Lawsonibacter sp.]|nr:zinc ribbon domain-containing protein [Lawsonibacter sp.]